MVQQHRKVLVEENSTHRTKERLFPVSPLRNFALGQHCSPFNHPFVRGVQLFALVTTVERSSIQGTKHSSPKDVSGSSTAFTLLWGSSFRLRLPGRFFAREVPMMRHVACSGTLFTHNCIDVSPISIKSTFFLGGGRLPRMRCAGCHRLSEAWSPSPALRACAIWRGST